MAYTSDDLTTIERAIASGTRLVRFSDGREIQYHSMQDLMAARADIALAVTTQSNKPAVRQIRIYTNKGF
jgi:hypothetical protein